MDLNSDSFLLHALCDEYIGDNIGNDIKSTIGSFMKHIPNLYKRNLDELYRKSVNIETFLDIVANVNLDFTKYKIGRWEEIIDIHGYTTKKCKMSNNVDNYIVEKRRETFLKEIKMNVKYEVPERYLSENLFIDIELEKNLNVMAHNLITNIITESLDKPVYIPFRYNNTKIGHLIGLILTSSNIIITNSGEGLEYHKTRKNYISQCIIFLDRPDNSFLYDFLLAVLHMRLPLENASIDTVYTEIFKVYWTQLIKNNNLMEEITLAVNENINNLFLTIDKTKIKEISDIAVKSEIYFPLWKHVSYYSQSEYAFESDLNIKFNAFVSSIFKDEYIPNLSYIQSWEDIQMYISKKISDLLMTEFEKLISDKLRITNCKNICNLIGYCIFKNFSLSNEKIILFNVDEKKTTEIIGDDLVDFIGKTIRCGDAYYDIFNSTPNFIKKSIAKSIKIENNYINE